MEDQQSWDWGTDLKQVPVGEWESEFNWVEECCVSPDGERVARIVNVDDMTFSICTNGQVQDGEYEKIWGLRALPDNRFAAFVCGDEEWTLSIDGVEWSSRFDFIWDLQITPDGNHIGIAFQKDSEYGMAVDDSSWPQLFTNMSGMALARTGDSAAVVQIAPLPGADVDAFKEGLFSIAVNGTPFDKRFLNIWDIHYDKSGQKLASTIRLDWESYTIALNDSIWERKFQAAWNPIFSNEGNVLAPVRDQGKWKLFMDNEPFWKNGYEQLWKVTLSPVNDDIAAIVATSFGKWSVAVNDRIWDMNCDTMISDICYSDNGACLTAVIKDKKTWDLAVNQCRWQINADKPFKPSISPDGSMVAAVIEKQGRHHLVMNNKILASDYEFIADPVFSPDQSKLLVKGVKNGVYERRLLSL